jgi:hypothetical protein
MNKAKAEPAKPQQVRGDDPGLVAFLAEMAAVDDRNRAAFDKARSEGATQWQREGFRRGNDGKMHPYSEMVPVCPPEPEELTDEAVEATTAKIAKANERNQRYLARLKPHELARLETWLRTRTHNSPPPVRPTSSPSIVCPPSREVRNGRGHGDRRGERPRSSNADDPDPDPDPEHDRRARLCAFCNGEIPADRSPKATHCSDQHADRDRQRRKRQRDRARNQLPRIPTTADFQRMRELTSDDLMRLRNRVACRCNGDHQEFDPGWCFRCGHLLPHEVTIVSEGVGV